MPSLIAGDKAKSSSATGVRSAQPGTIDTTAGTVGRTLTSSVGSVADLLPGQPTGAKPGVGPYYPRAFALVIGMDQYAHLQPLKKAVSDSTAVADALRSHGFTVTHKKNLNSAELRDALEDFFYQTGSDKDAALLLWYAGHGHSHGPEGYLLPVDTPSLNGNDVDFRRKAYSMRNFGTLMREARARHVLSVFDSCFAGTIFKTTRAALPPAIEQANKYPVRQFITAGDHSQEVNDDGAFQRAFIQAVTGQDASADGDRNGYVTGEELGIYMKTRILAASNGTQTPQFGKLADNDFERGDFIFRVGAAGGIPEMAAVVPAPAPPRMAAGQRDPLTFMRTTKVYLAAVYGAPGNGNAALRQSLSDRLLQKGFQVVDYDTEFAYKVHGTVQKRNVGALVDELTIKWQVYGVSREPLGVVEEKLEILSGARDAQWGDSATSSATFAADRLQKFLAKPS